MRFASLQEDNGVLKPVCMRRHITPCSKQSHGTQRCNSSTRGLFLAQSKDTELEHLVHHFKFGTEIDPALVYYQDLGIDQLSKCSTGQFYWRLLIKPFIGFSTWWHIRYTIYDHFKMQPSTILPLALFWGPILIIATLLGALKWLILFYLIPYFVLFTIIMHFSEVEDHASLYFNPTLASTRNNIGSIIHSFFLHAHDDGYHLVHHLNPKIPAHLLKKAHEECMKIPEFRDLAVNAHSFKETVHQIRRPKKIPAV